MNGDNSTGFIPDPDYEGWDGVFIGIENPPTPTHYLKNLIQYMRGAGKTFKELTQEEIEMFRIPGK